MGIIVKVWTEVAPQRGGLALFVVLVEGTTITSSSSSSTMDEFGNEGFANTTIAVAIAQDGNFAKSSGERRRMGGR